MHVSSLVEMIESAFDDRLLLGATESIAMGATGADIARLARAGATALPEGCTAVIYVGESHPLLPIVVFASAWAGVPFIPLNYRLDDDRLNRLIAQHPGALVLSDSMTAPRLRCSPQSLGDWLNTLNEMQCAVEAATDDNSVAIILYTSGTTSEPKAALLRHRHLMAYLLGSVEFASAGSDEAVLISVPPYHIAGVANMLSNLFAGRRLVYMRSFDPAIWLHTVRDEGVTNAMVVPTMLARIVESLDGKPAQTPTLRSLSYGGAAISERVLRSGLEAFPDTGFVNAYGLTETASTIAVLGPEDHRVAMTSGDPVLRRRLSSAGLVLPTVEVEIREGDLVQPVGVPGMIYVRGEQIAGEYATGSVLDEQGWFCTRDRGSLDADGYLFIEGRVDDTIIRGGENIAPSEIEAVLLADPDVVEACVVGVPDDEWGQRIAAVVILREGATINVDALRERVRTTLRGSKTPDFIEVRDALPHTDTGKLLRRHVQEDLAAAVAQ